jgi:hypothetical protein
MRQALLSRGLLLQPHTQTLHPCPCWLLRPVHQRDVIQLGHTLPCRHVQPVDRQRLVVGVHSMSSGDVQPLDRKHVFISLHPLSGRDVQPRHRQLSLHPLSCRDVRPVDRQRLVVGVHRMSSRDVRPVNWQLVCGSVPRLSRGHLLLGSCIHLYATRTKNHSPFAAFARIPSPSVCSLYRVPAGLLLPLLRHGGAYPVSIKERLPARKFTLSFRGHPLVLPPPAIPPATSSCAAPCMHPETFCNRDP